MKIAIVGTHGTGKSTLSYLLASHYKKQGKNVKIIQEVARNCPYPINKQMSYQAALWIYYEHAKKELESQLKHEVVISDRSVFDSFVYAEYFKLTELINYSLQHIALEQLKENYNKVIFIRPDIPLQSDGVRSTDGEFQKGIDEIFYDYMSLIDHIEIKTSYIFEDKWKKYCL